VRLINRLCDLLVAICPALERAVGYSVVKGLVVILAKYQTPAALHRTGVKRTGDQAGAAQGPGGWRRRSQDGMDESVLRSVRESACHRSWKSEQY
jgi:hypothetical protein